MQQVPARAAAAAAVARALAGTPPHEKISFLSSSEVVSIYGSRSQGQTIDELEEDFYEEVYFSGPSSHIIFLKNKRTAVHNMRIVNIKIKQIFIYVMQA